MRAIVLALLILFAPLTRAAVVGVVTEVSGDCRLLRGDRYLAASEGVEVRDDDIVETASAASTQLEMNDGSMLKLGANSRVLLADYRLDTNHNVITAGIDVLSGWLRFAVARLARPDGRYGINTPTMTIGIRGTEGVIEAANERGALHLETGEVTLRAEGAGSVPLRDGEFVERARGSAFTRPRAVPAEFRQRLPGNLQSRAVRRAHLLRQRGVAAREIRRLQPADRERLLREHPHWRQRFERHFRGPPPGAGNLRPRPAAAPGRPAHRAAAKERLQQERAIKHQKEKGQTRQQRRERKKQSEQESRRHTVPEETVGTSA